MGMTRKSMFLVFFSAMTVSLIIMIVIYGLFLKDIDFDLGVKDPSLAPKAKEYLGTDEDQGNLPWLGDPKQKDDTTDSAQVSVPGDGGGSASTSVEGEPSAALEETTSPDGLGAPPSEFYKPPGLEEEGVTSPTAPTAPEASGNSGQANPPAAQQTVAPLPQQPAEAAGSGR